MDEIQARTLADAVAQETGHEASVEREGNAYVVEVHIAKPRSGALHETYTLWDDLDWAELRERIRDA